MDKRIYLLFLTITAASCLRDFDTIVKDFKAIHQQFLDREISAMGFQFDDQSKSQMSRFVLANFSLDKNISTNATYEKGLYSSNDSIIGVKDLKICLNAHGESFVGSESLLRSVTKEKVQIVLHFASARFGITTNKNSTNWIPSWEGVSLFLELEPINLEANGLDTFKYGEERLMDIISVIQKQINENYKNILNMEAIKYYSDLIAPHNSTGHIIGNTGNSEVFTGKI